MCGLLGHLGNKINKVNIDKFNILGILNETRGTDSCGVTMDGSILKGVGSLKTYRDFAAYYVLKQPEYSHGIIGHTRKSTFGSNSLENAHPFGFGSMKIKNSKKDFFEFVGVHNGTLINHSEIALNKNISLKKNIKEKYEIQEEGVKKTKIRDVEVTKIDSEVLLERLYTDKDFSVLSEYNGAAALIWQNLNNPEKMYFFHGKSAESDDSDTLKEERPLYYWKENKNSLYVSSILDSLYIIGGDEKTIGEFEHNVVYEVTNGDISKAKKTKIDRSKNYITKTYVSTSSQNIGFQRPSSNASSIAEYRNRTNARLGKRFYESKVIKNLTNSQQIRLDLELPIDKGLLSEKFDFDPNKNKGLTVCKKLRHYKNGHLADGVFCFIPGNGFMYLGESQKDAIRELKNLAGKYFYDKQFHDEKPEGDLVYGFKADYFVPFSVSAMEKNPILFLHYMFEGIRMKTYVDWRAAVNNKTSEKNKFDIVSLSIVAAHPIIDINDQSSRRPGVYLNGVLADGSYSFLGSRKMYKFSHGQVTDISYIKGFEPEEYNDDESKTYTTFEDAARFLTESVKVNGYANLKEKDYLKELVSLDEAIESLQRAGFKTKILNQEVEDFIDKTLVNAFAEKKIDYKKLRDTIWRYSTSSTKAELACRTLKKLIELNG